MAVAAYPATILITAQPSIAMPTDQATTTTDSQTYTLTNATYRYLDPATPVVVQAQFDEVQQIAITGSPAGGTFTLTFGAQTTGTINWNDPAGTVQTRLQALTSIGSGNALVTGGPGPNTPYIVQFTGTMAKTNEALITLANNSLTGGSSPSVSITSLADGSGTYTTINPIDAGESFTLYRCNARITFQQPLPGALVRFHSANYFAYSTLAEASSSEFAAKYTMEDVTTFNPTSGAKIYIPTLLEGTLKLGTFWISNVRAQSMIARDLLVASFVMPGGTNRYEGFVYASDLSIKGDPKKAVIQDITCTITNEFFFA